MSGTSEPPSHTAGMDVFQNGLENQTDEPSDAPCDPGTSLLTDAKEQFENDGMELIKCVSHTPDNGNKSDKDPGDDTSVTNNENDIEIYMNRISETGPDNDDLSVKNDMSDEKLISADDNGTLTKEYIEYSPTTTREATADISCCSEITNNHNEIIDSSITRDSDQLTPSNHKTIINDDISVTPNVTVMDKADENKTFDTEDPHPVYHELEINKNIVKKPLENSVELNMNTANLLETKERELERKIENLNLNQCDTYDLKDSPKSVAILNSNILKSEFSRTIGRSTISLNDNEITAENCHSTINRSPLSKSAENMLTLPETGNTRNTKAGLNASDSVENINAEKVLADFDAQKSKVTLPQNIPERNDELTLQEQKFPKSHKEMITQDFGSIVKNVHGIFSTVSGSLKHAYNISQRMPAQQININKLLTTGSLKNTANGKIMSNIFDNDQFEGDSSKLHLTTQEHSSIPNSNSSSPKKEDRKLEELLNSNVDVNKDFSITEEDKIDSLERALSMERMEVSTLREKMRQQAEELAEKEREKREMGTKMEMLRKRLDCSEREKDSAVMRYAVSERAVIGARDAADAARRAERAVRSEMELLAGKLKSAHAEKQRICQIYDDKCHELATSERETARLREELKESDNKLKWSQSKLRTEIDAYREAAGNVEKLSSQVSELEGARDAAAAHSADSGRLRQLESELKEAHASLILCRHDSEELERKLASSNQQLDSCQRQLSEATASVSRLEKQVSELRSSNVRLEEEAAELASLRARAALADTLAQQLGRETERATQAEEETSRERARAETCARREAAALEHSARLTAEHVGERALLRRQEHKANALGADNAGLRERVSALEVETTEARAQLSREAARRNTECRLLARRVAELTEELEQASKQLEWEKGENSVLRKKHASAVKELNRELQRTLKRCEQLEARAAEPPDASTPTGSISSLSSIEGAGGGAGAGNSSAGGAAADEGRVNGHARSDSVPDTQVREPDRQALIERIVQLQRAGARRAERCDFLEEHNRQLTAELRDKARLLRELLAGQPAGALGDNTADDHKREMARLGGGAMAAVWGGAADGMTLPLSLEINRKLQAVLEDALLKNITLKKNMDTLGEEIARLKASKEAT